MIDKSTGFMNDGTKFYSHGINNKSILNETLFEVERHGFFPESYPPVPMEINNDQKKILLERVQNSIKERIEIYKTSENKN